MSRPNPYARFERIHEACPDLVYLFHFLEYQKFSGEMPLADVQKGLEALSDGCKLLLSKLGPEHPVIVEINDRPREDEIKHVEQIDALLGDTRSPWSLLVEPHSELHSELLRHDFFSMVCDVFSEDEMPLGEVSKRIDEMLKRVTELGFGGSLADLDEQQAYDPDFRV